MSTNDLTILGHLQIEWSDYILGLRTCGFKITNLQDSLVWSWNIKNGEINAKQAYDSLFFNMMDFNQKWWHKALWKWYMPLKIKLFNLLMLENKILTWENFLKRSGTCLNICNMCYLDVETLDHLMVSCSFTQLVWLEVRNLLRISQPWNYQYVHICFKQWIGKSFS